MKATFDAELISRYNVSGARYTAYPTANVFATTDGADCWWALSEISPGKPISVYVHVPFYSTICYCCACNKINTGNHRHADAYVERLKVEMALVSQVLGGNHPVERISHLAVLGFSRMSIGIQDFDPAVQEVVNRIKSEAETRMIVDAARQNNFNSLNVDLIYGLPGRHGLGFNAL